ncbi:MAG: hypothetical protein DSY82_01220 [Flavobacteriia bacterium]|nr:MAG: hypothetical protein DSY82_01220 [Flavobacteriia bacterium]
MKKLILLIPTLLLFFNSCTTGPPGPPGPQGQDGLLAQIFEAKVSFSNQNNYEVLVEFPNNIKVFDTDIVMAYILTGVDNGVDIWEPLPQSLFFNDGSLLYGYNHTYTDIVFFLDGTVNLDTLDTQFTNNIVFRIAIIPADFAKTFNINNYNEVVRNLQSDNIIKLY